MSKVIRLPQHLINQIAAGEVIEGPESVVKELVENAIDASSSHIIVTLKNGGTKLIQVEDNGSGIEVDDMVTIFEPHTTSKISKSEDLEQIQTLGFRGEALSSIGAVADVTLTSKTDSSDSAFTVTVKENRVSQPTPTNRNRGTTIQIENLFQNIPARREFLRSPQTSSRKIISILNKIALAYPNIRFSLIKDDREVFDYLAIKDSQALHPDRVKDVVSESTFSSMIPLHLSMDYLVIGGYVGHPKIARNTALEQYIFINQRPVWDRGITKSVQNGMGRFIPENCKVPFIISIQTKHRNVDVNVHPRKEEVRFLNPYRIYSVVEDAVRSAVEATTKDDLIYDSYTDENSGGYNAIFRLRETNVEPAKYRIHQSTNFSTTSQAIKFNQQLLTDTGVPDSHKDSSPKNIHQFLSRYVILEKGDEVWIIDQHAAAERIRFEELMSIVEGGLQSTRQQLLVPTVMHITAEQVAALQELHQTLETLGFSLQIADDSLTISAIPLQLKDINLEAVILELISLAFEDETTNDSAQLLNNKLEDLIATLACHSSLRANQAIHSADAEHIVQKLLACKNAYSCPHGRPIIWRLTSEDIDRNFKR